MTMYLFFSRSDQSRCRFCPGNLFPQFAPCSSVQAIKVILLWPCCSEKPQPAGATFQELVHVVQVGNNLISHFFLVALRGEQYFPNSSNEPHSRLFLVWQQHEFFLIYGLVLHIKLLFSFCFSSHCTISFMDNKCPVLCLWNNSFLL